MAPFYVDVDERALCLEGNLHTERNVIGRKTWWHQTNTQQYLPSIVRKGVRDVACTQNQYEQRRQALLYCRPRDFPFSYRLLSAKTHSSTIMPTSSDIRANTRSIIDASATITNHRQAYQNAYHWAFVNVSTPSSTCIALKIIERIPKINSRGP